MKYLNEFVSKKLTIITLILFTLSVNLEGQISGFGTGFAVEVDPNLTSGFLYLDDVKAEVTSFGSSTSATLCVNISSTYKQGNFAVDNMAVLIQMKGGTVGRHQNVWIKTNNCSPTTDLKLEAVNGTMLSYSVGGGANLQLVIIHRFDDFTLSGGTVTCSPYNGHIGGILPIIVNGTLAISGGLITVDGKGYTAADAGHTYAPGGAGAPAATTPTPLSLTPAPGFWWFDGGSGCGSVAIGGSLIGSKGGQANNTSSSGSANGAGTPFSKATFNSLLVMGNPGSFISGYGSGDGAGGGGFGGTGGNNSLCATTGTAGTSGMAGGSGGAAGKGGRGGGAMIIKAIDVNITSNSVVISANGGNALKGGNGANGGAGGAGGPGGQGCCGSAGMDAGAGGYGDEGVGGTGGDGGNGGDAGFIWIACNNNYTYTASNNYFNYSIQGGAGANAGKGGWGEVNYTSSTIPGVNRCSGADCTSGATTCKFECNVDYSMCFLAANAQSADVVGSSLDTKFYSSQSCTGLIGQYKNSINTLEVYDGCDTYISIWEGSTKTPADMFKHFRTCSSPSKTALGFLDYSNAPNSSGCGSPGAAVHIDFYDGSIPPQIILTYDHESPDGPAFIHEIETENTIFTEDCNDVGAPSKVSDGRTGSMGTNGTFSSGQNPQNDNIKIDVYAMWKRSLLKNTDLKNQLNAKVFPNPTSKDVWIDIVSTNNEKLIINLMDINGKSVLTQNELLKEGANKLYLNVKDINRGIYLLELKTIEKISMLKLKID